MKNVGDLVLCTDGFPVDDKTVGVVVAISEDGHRMKVVWSGAAWWCARDHPFIEYAEVKNKHGA